MKPTAALFAAAAMLVAGGARAETTELVIYKDAQFRGESQVIKGEVANLENGFGHQASSAVVRGGAWEVCTADHFKGKCRVLQAGSYPTLGYLDEHIVSVRFLGADKVVRREDRQEDRRDDRRNERSWRQGAIELYGQPGFRGRSVLIDDNMRDLGVARFDDRASSAVVREGTWQLCTEQDFRGQCSVLRPGEYPRLSELEDRVTSVRRMR